MKCKDIHTNWIGYLEKTLSERERQAMEKHLSHCTSCNALIENVKNTYTLFDHKKGTGPSPFFVTRVEQALTKRIQQEPVSPVLAIRWMPVAASFLLLLAIGTGILVGNKLSSGLSVQTTTYTTSEMFEAYTSGYDTNHTLSLESIFYNE